MIQLKKRYEQQGINTYIMLENFIVKRVTSGSEVITAVDQYPELDESTLYTQFIMVKQMTAAEELSLDLVVAKLVGMDPVVCKLFPLVEMLVHLLLTIPFSSAEAERSFFGLRRLKTYMSNSITQMRLNHLAVLHVHREITDNVDIVVIAKAFVSKCDSRLYLCSLFTKSLCVGCDDFVNTHK